jgi:aldose 1-epimerase
VVEVGGGLRELFDGDRPLLDGYAEAEVCGGARGQLLIPWPNRVDGGRYSFADQPRQLALTEPDRACAIHGFTRWSSWHPEAEGPERVLLTHRLHPHPGWPHALALSVEYTLHAEDGLTVRLTAVNVGGSELPYGCGAHPYLTVGAPSLDACTLELKAATRLLTDARGIPTGPEAVEGTPYDFRTPRSLNGVQLDHAFTDLTRDAEGRAWVTLRGPDGAAVSLWVDEGHPWIEIFTGDHLKDPTRRRKGLGVEPMSCPPNAFASGKDVRVLAPGASATHTWGIVPGGPPSSRDVAPAPIRVWGGQPFRWSVGGRSVPQD